MGTSKSVLFLLSSDEDTWLEHAIAGWDDEPLKMSNLEIRKTTNEQHNSGFTKIGKLLLAIFEQLDLQGADNVMDYLWEHEELLIDVNSLDIKRFEEIRDLHKTHLRDWFNWFKQSMTVTNFLKNLFVKILQCDVTVYDTQSGKVVEAKKKLVEHYVKLNKMVPLKTK